MVVPRELPMCGTRVGFNGEARRLTGVVVARCFSVFTVDVQLDDGRRYRNVPIDELERP